MDEITLVLGGEVRCAGAPEACGEVKSLVVDVNSGQVTHLVVEPEDRQGLARLVPLGEITDAAEGGIRLRGTVQEFRGLPAAEETIAELVPGYGEVQLLPSGEGWRPADDGDEVVDGRDFRQIGVLEEIDLVPEQLGPAEDEEHGGDRVHATDGDIGELHALGVDLHTGKVTSVLLKEHLWGSSEVKIPAADVSGFRAGVHLRITKQQVESLHVGTGQPGE